MEERQQQQVPPHSTDAERSVLGGMLIDGGALELALEQLREEDFYLPAHQAIFSGMREIRSAGGAVDLVTLSNALERHGKLEMVGGALYLSELMGFVPTAANAQEYIGIVEEKSVRRLLIRAGGEIIRYGVTLGFGFFLFSVILSGVQPAPFPAAGTFRPTPPPWQRTGSTPPQTGHRPDPPWGRTG